MDIRLHDSYSYLALSPAKPVFRVEGIVQEKNVPIADVLVRLFSRNDAKLIGQTLSDTGGSFKFRLASNREVFVLAHHPKRQFNAVIQDIVRPA